MRVGLYLSAALLASSLAGCRNESSAPAQTNAAAPATPAVANPNPTAKQVHLGGTFVGAPEVEVSDLLMRPDSFRGKTVTVAGKVSGMCFHRRSWYSLSLGEAGSEYLRVITEPSFQVPEDAVGRPSRAEGTIEVVEVDGGTAQHYAQDHKLGGPVDAARPLQQVILRATAAEFM